MERKKVQVEETTKCPECGSEHIIRDYERGELVCGDCGIVINDLQIDMGPEWRAFDSAQNEQRARTGAPMTFRTIESAGRPSSPRIPPERNSAFQPRLSAKAAASAAAMGERQMFAVHTNRSRWDSAIGGRWT